MANSTQGAADRAVNDVKSGASKLPADAFKTDAERNAYNGAFDAQNKK